MQKSSFKKTDLKDSTHKFMPMPGVPSGLAGHKHLLPILTY